jgi:CubicO group peptidase (beta-lactamase class C family)
MKKILFTVVLFLAVFSCKEENPRPSGFFEYSAPYYQGMDASLLKQLDEEIKLGVFGDIHSLLILRNGTIVFENYYANYQRDDLHAIGAATQSIISAVVGTQEYQEDSFTITSKIVNYFPEYTQYFDNIPQKDQIEIGHLLSHTSGLWWDEWSHPFGNESNDAYVMSLSNDWVENVLATPMIKEPGNEFNFNSGNAVLMAPILEKITGKELEMLTEERLFEPLGINEWNWERTPGDYVNAGWGLKMKPIDMLKVGQLFLNNGVWEDHELFDETWRGRSTRRRNNVSSYYGYGYFWWSFGRAADVVRYLSNNDVFFSWGEGGQFIFVIPHLSLVVATTAGNYNNSDTKAIEILRDYIFTSVNNRFP